MKLNIGSGSVHLDDYINIDCEPSFKPDILGRVQDISFPLGSIDEIYASHILEHLPPLDFPGVLWKFKAWLKEDGKLLVAVPDMRVLAELLIGGIREDVIFEIVFGKPGKDFIQRHQWGFTEHSLTTYLELVGFKVVGKFPPREDSSGYKIDGKLVSLNLECVKDA